MDVQTRIPSGFFHVFHKVFPLLRLLLKTFSFFFSEKGILPGKDDRSYDEIYL